MAWYSIGLGAFVDDAPVKLSVTGWDSGVFGKLVFFTGLAVLLLLLLDSTGLELPPAFPSGAAVSALGTLGTIFVLVRAIDIPSSLELPGTERSVGIWISLVAGIAVVASGLLKASEELGGASGGATAP
jgi:hypothetical protein